MTPVEERVAIMKENIESMGLDWTLTLNAGLIEHLKAKCKEYRKELKLNTEQKKDNNE
jgi:hypothetical protein